MFCLVDNPTVTIKNLNANGNTAKDMGGVMYQYAWGGKVDISGSTFTSNNAANKGGAIWMGAKSPVTITGGSFTGNTSKVGGALFLDTSLFSGNGSSANVTITGGTMFDGNQATGGDGGAIHIADSTSAGTYATSLTMNGVTLKNNKASGKGGALATDAASPNLVIKATNCTFNANESGYGGSSGSGGGGAVEIQNGNSFGNGDPGSLKIVFTNCTFTGNLGDGTGGAIDIRSGSYVKFDGLTATGNKSVPKWNGAVIYLTSDASRLYLAGTITASGNTAGSADKFLYAANASNKVITTNSNTASWVAMTYCAGTLLYNPTMP